MNLPLPVSVLTGFLGSGKTTLLNRLLRDPALVDTAVIVNEFGEVAIDHLLVESSSDGVIELSGGCICCTVRGDLVDTLAGIVDSIQTGRTPSLKRVIIETTGLADPVPVLLSLMGHPALMQAFRLDGVIATVDAINGLATIDRHAEAARQIAVADRIVLTKTDMAEPPADLLATIRRLNPGAPIVPSAVMASVADLFNCGLYDPATKTADVGRWLRDEAIHQADHHDHDHDHGHHHHHDHDHHRHDHIRSFSLVHDRPVPYSAIETFLDLLRSTQGERLLRMKGVIELAEDPSRPLVIHGVQSMLHPPARLPFWPEGPRGVRLVVIGDGLPEDYVRRLFSAITGQVAIGVPDRAAIEDNPLAIAGFRA
ncbi:CobW family GTP-binding protein [Mesorhizobium australicum]|uniref:GTPase, G3E family n=1 Tax=Mesorhizobium australicum TaxID=536018 RepID=A0A1X7PTM5_9HYPH|nr:GTP-binding protein [Mesorhizobium australicum]SMH55334.1 GTPase, G3E family [Mesorhizobium australicum]